MYLFSSQSAYLLLEIVPAVKFSASLLSTFFVHFFLLTFISFKAMVRKSEIAAFQFVNSSNGLVPQNGDIRTQIRKQAMSRVASNRKQRGNYGKHNLRQLPVYVDTTENIRLSSDRYQKSLDLDQHQAPGKAERSTLAYNLPPLIWRTKTQHLRLCTLK